MAPVGSGRASISVMLWVCEVVDDDSQRALAAPHPAHPPPMITYFFLAGVVRVVGSVSSELVDRINDVVCNLLLV